ncbi:hypothetical protein GQ53DRAFT_180915 [Thozetella sp. PMI_491]|nr:hypothetical protein GQ53DRAFT_180915 [Thozetella sp. PMI_491]
MRGSTGPTFFRFCSVRLASYPARASPFLAMTSTMFSCSTCGRSYASRTSLARHHQNHRKTNQHVCVHCNVVFYRRDLLARHLRSHERLSPSIDADGDRREARKRCHTACVQCRALKIKCSGNVPCDNCAKLDKPCRLTNPTSRLSHLAEPEDQSDAMSDMVPTEDPGCELQPEPGLPSPRTGANSTGTIHDLGSLSDASPSQQSIHNAFSIPENADLTMTGVNPLDLLEDGPQLGASPDGANMGLGSFMLESLSWPWHHELSYLLGSESLDLVGQASATTQHQSGEPQHVQSITNVNSTAQSSSSSASQTSEQNGRPSSIFANRPGVETGTEQPQLLDEIMTFALAARSDPSTSHEYSSLRDVFSSKVAKAFNIEQRPESEGTPLLEHFVHLYFAHFDPLWPLFSTQNLDINRLHPLLYLVLVSTGAMYADNKSGFFGTKMHARVQACLVEPLELRDPDYDSPWLAQARCISRMAALYFGQSRAISHAHHLGTLLVAQVRRMELFSAAYSQASMEEFHSANGTLTDQERLTIWLRTETRRRLAFGIFRSEAYTSLLLQSKPLFYLAEIDLAFPSCDAVWKGEKMPASVCIHLIENDRTPGRDLYASEIYHIALDGEETLPPMDPLGYELLALGLLWPTWEYSRNPTMLLRLCGEELSLPDGLTESSVNLSASPQSANFDATRRPLEIRDYDHLDRTSRKMVSLHSGYRRLLLALRKWEQSLPMVKSFARSQRDRTLLMSGLIVYHLVHLRLSAPATDLHELQYRLIDGRPPDAGSLGVISGWLHSQRARFAAERAVSIWSLIAGERAKHERERARFNLVAFAGLHDAAVLLWAYASTVSPNGVGSADGFPLVLRRDSQSACIVNRGNTAEILDLFGSLLDVLTPGKSSSFAQATKGLMGIPFPHETQPLTL